MTDSTPFRNRVLRGFLSVFGGQAGVAIVWFVGVPILVRILGTARYGDYAFVLSALGLLTIAARVGISAGLRKFIAERRPVERWEERVFGFYWQLGMGLAIAIAALVVTAAYSGVIGDVFGARFTPYFYVVAAILVVRQLLYVARYTLMGLHQEVYSESIHALDSVLFAVCGLLLAYVGFGVTGLLLGAVLGAGASAAVAFWVLRRHVDVWSALRPALGDLPWRELVGFNVANTVFVFLTISLYHVDILLLQYFLGSEPTGVYKAALVVAEFLWFVPIAIQTVFIHSSAQLWSEDRFDQLDALASRTTRYNLAFTLLLVIGIAALADPFVRTYFGPEFAGAVVPLWLLLPGAVGFAIARPVFAINQGIGELRLLIYATGVSALVNVLLNVLLIPRYGLVGAAVATTIGYGSMGLFHVAAALHVGFDPVADLRLRRIALTGVITAPVVFGLAHAIDSAALALVVVPPAGFVVYAAVTLRLRVVDPDELDELLDSLPEPLQERGMAAIRILGRSRDGWSVE